MIKDIMWLNAQFHQYCKLNDLNLAEIDSEKRELFMSAWFAGFSDGFVVSENMTDEQRGKVK